MKIITEARYVLATEPLHEENEESLRFLCERTRTKLQGIQSLKRRREIISIRILLSALGIKDEELTYTVQGAPRLSDDRHISISHSKDRVGIVLSDEPVGLDMQYEDEKLRQVSDRLLLPSEKLHRENLQALTLIWTAKEAAYKLLGIPGLGFSDMEVTLPAKTEKQGHFTGRLLKGERNIIGFDYRIPEEKYTLTVAMYQLGS